MMMKIHTTQNLTSIRRNQDSTNSAVIPNDEIRLNYSEQMRQSHLFDQPDSFEGRVSFKGKKGPTVKDAKKVINTTKKLVGDIAKESQPEMKRGDSLNDSPLFNKILNFANNELLATASIAAVACMLRAITIGALPAKDENTKINNKYAIGHTLASGTVGFATAFLLTAPFKGGADYVRKNLWKNMSETTLKRFHPHLNIESITENGKRLDMKHWKDKANNKFSQEIRNCAYLPEFKQIGDVSEQTFKHILKVDADWASQKGKSFNDVVLKDGSKLYDKIDMSRLGIVVDEEGMNKAQILLKDIDKSYLENIIKDSKTNWGNLDINSVYKNGEVVDFRQWKDVNGKEWKLDLDETFVASPYETFADYRPRITGEKRFDKKEKVYKFRTYQNNGVNDKLGTKISDEMLESDAKNEVLFKFLTYFPDLAFRIPIAMTTVALIPWMLKNFLGLEKKKAPEQQPQKVLAENNKEKNTKIDENKDVNNVAFKGGKKEPNWFVKKLGEYYGKPLMEKEWVANLTSHLTKLPGRTTQHMSVLGSLITSGMYVQQTLKKKELDPDKRRTLAVNQTLGFFVPTIAAYFVDSKINNWVKQKEYRFTGRQQHNIDVAKLEGNFAKAKAIEKTLGTKKNGVRILADLVTFTLIYRYVVPVLVTPIANKIGDRYNAKLAEKRRLAQEQQKQNV